MRLNRRKYIYVATLALGVVSTGCEDADTPRDAGTSDGSTLLEGGSAQDSGGRGDDASTDDASSGGWGDDPLEVTVAGGTLAGTSDGEARSFLGIPYAKPPVGELRWAPPQPADPWDGVREAKEFGGRCAQNESTTLQNAASATEDCLYLNVWTPPKPGAEPYPVMVWIHGGGNQNGSASEPVPYRNEGVFYSGRDLAEQHGVLVVTLNYRLGVFGFMAHPDLASEEGGAGNQGLRDQRMALQWVHDNIDAFGGDPDNVTLFGESAGSFDVCLHVASPESRGLFHRAVSQSGGCTTKMTEKAEAEAAAQALVSEVGCEEADDALQCLREASVADLLASMETFDPYVDGQFVPDQPRALYDAGEIADVPYMLGSNTDEGTLFLTSVPIEDETVYMGVLSNVFGETLAPQIAAEYPPSDFEDALPNPAKAAAARAIGDGRLVCTTYDTAVRAQAQGRTVFTYNFDVPTPMELTQEYIGAAHGAELAYVFGTSTTAQEDPDLEAVSNLMQRYWSRFAAEGDPNGGDDLKWPAFSPEDDRRLNFAVEPSVVEDFRADRCEFWRSIYDLRFEEP